MELYNDKGERVLTLSEEKMMFRKLDGTYLEARRLTVTEVDRSKVQMDKPPAEPLAYRLTKR